MGKDRLPTIHFQGRLLLVSGRVKSFQVQPVQQVKWTHPQLEKKRIIYNSSTIDIAKMSGLDPTCLMFAGFTPGGISLPETNIFAPETGVLAPFQPSISRGEPLGFRERSYRWMSLSCHMGVSKNNGTPKSSILIGFYIINIHFGVFPYFWVDTHIINSWTFQPWKIFNPPTHRPQEVLRSETTTNWSPRGHEEARPVCFQGVRPSKRGDSLGQNWSNFPKKRSKKKVIFSKLWCILNEVKYQIYYHIVSLPRHPGPPGEDRCLNLQISPEDRLLGVPNTDPHQVFEGFWMSRDCTTRIVFYRRFGVA